MRAKRSILTYFTQSFSSVILLVLSLISTPLILKAVGSKTYGQYRLILEYLGYFGLLEFGLYSTTRILLSESFTIDKDRVLNVIRSSLTHYIWIALSSIFLLSVLTSLRAFIPQINIISDKQVYLASLFIALGFILLPLSPIKASLESEQRGYIVEAASFINKALNIILILILTLYKLELFTFFAVLFIANLTSNLFILYKSNFSLKDVLFSKDQKLLSQKESKSTRYDIFLFDLAGKLNLSSDAIIISFFNNIEVVTVFFISQRLTNVVSSFIYGISNSLWPALSNMYFNKEMDLLRDKILFCTRLSGFVAIFFLTPILFLNSKFISLWVGESFVAGPIFNTIIVANAFAQTLLSLWGWLISSTNNTHLARKSLIISTLSNIILSLCFTYYLGIIGPILGTLATSLLVTLPINQSIIKKLFSINATSLFTSWFRSSSYLIALFLIYNFAYPKINQTHFLKFVIEGILITGVNATLSYFLLLHKEDRIYLLEKLGGLRGK